MAALTQEEIQLLIEVNTKGLELAQAKFRKLKIDMMSDAQKVKQGLVQPFLDQKKAITENVKGLKEQSKAIEDNAFFGKRFKGELLSIMFLGMAITRTFGGFLTAAFQTFNKVTEGTSAANSQVGRLRAAWEFFKYSLINALLNNPMFQSFLEWIISLVDWFNSLSDTTKVFLGVGIGVAIAFGTLLTVVGLVGLGLIGLVQTWQLFMGTSVLINGELVKIPGTLTKITATLKAMFAWLAGPGKIVSIIAGWVFAVIAFLTVANLLHNKFGSWVGAIKSWVSAIALAIVGIVQLVVQGVKTMIDYLMTLIARLLDTLGSVARGLGLKKIANMADSAAKSIGRIVSYQIDFLGPTSELLDKIGFNPQEVRPLSVIPQTQDGATQGNIITQYNNIEISDAGELSTKEASDKILAEMNERLIRSGNGAFTI